MLRAAGVCDQFSEEWWGRVFTAKVDGARGPAGAAQAPGADE